MVQSAMADAEIVGVEPGGAGESRLDLRQAVLAGPGAGADVDDEVRGAVVSWLADGDAIGAALTASGHVDVRRRVLTGETTVLSILGLCLYSGEGYDSVLARVLPAVPGALAPGGKVPGGSALSQARARLPVGSEGEPLRRLFETTAAADGDEVPPGGTAFGLELTAFDGTVFDLAASREIAAQFATPSGGRFPQARLVTLVSCGTRRVRAAALGSSGDSEQGLVDGLRDALGPGMLNLSDRNFFSMARWVDFSATGAHLAWRVKNGAKSLPAKVIEVLSDGSSHVRLRESYSMFSRRRAAAGDPELPRLPDTIARLVEFDLLVVDERGRTRRSRFRILTTLLDHRAFPAKQIAALYAERWQVELVYHRIKVSLRGSGVVLRGQTPDLARQEVWGFLVVYNALVDLAVRAAVSLGVDPDEISFVAVLRLARAYHTSGCAHCGHCATVDPTDALVAAIAAHPRNRTGRQRTSPRTKAQRRTERTRNVTYTIDIVSSNLPIAA
jgi:Insertion element 4 transposase N-terminal/Transposase DDE domain